MRTQTSPSGSVCGGHKGRIGSSARAASESLAIATCKGVPWDAPGPAVRRATIAAAKKRRATLVIIDALTRFGAACERARRRVSVVPMPPAELSATLKGLFDAERAVREAHDQLVNSDPG